MKTKKRKILLGVVGVDSGQLVICDPAYIDSEYIKREDDSGIQREIWKHKKTGKLWQFTYSHKRESSTRKDVNPFPATYSDVIPEYGKSPNELIQSKEFVPSGIDPNAHIEDGEFSYPGICKTTLDSEKSGQLNYKMGFPGVAVAFSSGFGDGMYNVYAEIADMGDYGERISKVWVELITPKEIRRMNQLSEKK